MRIFTSSIRFWHNRHASNNDGMHRLRCENPFRRPRASSGNSVGRWECVRWGRPLAAESCHPGCRSPSPRDCWPDCWSWESRPASNSPDPRFPPRSVRFGCCAALPSRSGWTASCNCRCRCRRSSECCSRPASRCAVEWCARIPSEPIRCRCLHRSKMEANVVVKKK